MVFRFLFVLALVALNAGCAAIGATSGRIAIQGDHTRVAVAFSQHDRAVIGNYYSKHRRRLPPGLAKRRGGLPPGLAKHEKLPPGLRREPLPEPLARQLSPVPSGYVRVRVGRDIVLLDSRTHVVIDVIYDIAF